MREKGNIFTKTWGVCVLAVLCCVLWGSAYPGIKIGYELFSVPQDDSASQILFAGLRFAAAGGIAVLLGSAAKKRILLFRRSSLWMVLCLAGVQTVAQYIFFYIGLGNAPAVRSSIINGSASFFSILIACFIFRQEKFTAKKLAACAMGLFAVVLLNTGIFSSGGGVTLNGEGFILFSTISYAFSACLIKIFSKHEDPVALAGWQFVIGGAVMIAIGLLLGGRIQNVSSEGMGVLIYLACLSAAAYSLWGQLLKYNPVSKVAVFGFMIPVSGSVLSALFLGEVSQLMDIKTLISLALVCAGIILINRENAKKRLPPV
jgi:drug/metabolite transporter (DMT)-like permease